MPRSSCRVLLTGFEPFGDLLRNPSGDAARRLGRDPKLRAIGLRTAVLPVDRREAPRLLLELLERHRPEVLLMTGVAAGRPAISVERVAINVYRPAGDRGAGRAIRRGGADGLFGTLPLGAAVKALGARGAPAVISESAGTFTCNLVLYTALAAASRPDRVGFIHLPASPESLPEGDARPSQSLDAMVGALARLIRSVR